jgi:uncharacterized surface protein with fasciclin (FAS1) repeats
MQVAGEDELYGAFLRKQGGVFRDQVTLDKVRRYSTILDKKKTKEKDAMRIKIALMTILLVLLSVGTALSQPVTMYDTLKAAGNFNTFLSAVDKANIQELKAMPGAFTLFAPTDEAFAKLPAGTMDTIMASSARVQDLVYYHITPGKYMAKDLVVLKECKTLCPTDRGGILKLTLVGDKYMVGTANIIKPDVVASNGIIQVIDAVLMPTWAPKSDLPATTK